MVLSSDIIGERCRTSANSDEATPPTVWVGESADQDSGCSLERGQLGDQRVELGVGDLGVVLEIAPGVIVDQAASSSARRAERSIGPWCRGYPRAVTVHPG